MNFPSISKVECRDTLDCPSGSYCSNGECVRLTSADDGTAGPNPGACELPPVIIEPCGETNGGCDEAGCGKAGSSINGEKSNCEEAEEEQEEKPSYFVACDPYADEYYKTYGELPNGGVGYSELNVCGECETCEYTVDYFCEPIDEFDFDASCKCLGGSDYCKRQGGNCQECDEESGDCYKKCQGCVVECQEFFTCPCDKLKTRYRATGEYEACRESVAYGPGGTCWQTVASRVRQFCEANHPCGSEDPCYTNCRTLKSTTGSPCDGFNTEGQVCRDRGFIKNEGTQETTYLAEVCDYDGENCGCNADPSSLNYVECSLCLECNKSTGECDNNGKCPGYIEVSGAQIVPTFRYELNSTSLSCYSCDPWNAAQQDGTGCSSSTEVDEDWGGSRWWNGVFYNYVNTGDFRRTTSGTYQANYSMFMRWEAVCSNYISSDWFQLSDANFSVKVGKVGSVLWQSVGENSYRFDDRIEFWQVEYTWKKDIFGWQSKYDGWRYGNSPNQPTAFTESASITDFEVYEDPNGLNKNGQGPRPDEDHAELLVSEKKLSLLYIQKL